MILYTFILVAIINPASSLPSLALDSLDIALDSLDIAGIEKEPITLPTRSTSCQPIYQQCGGIGWSGSTECCAGVCTLVNDYYFQCLLPETTYSSSTEGTLSSTTASTASPNPSSTTSHGIRKGTASENHLPPFSIKVSGNFLDTSLTLDANWRWVHEKQSYQNCFDQKSWNKKICPDSQTCAEKCVIEGVSKSQWASTYGVDVGSSSYSAAGVGGEVQEESAAGRSSSVTLKLVTGSNIGSRLFLMDQDKTNYYGFSLVNREFVFTVDASALGCGLNGALYLVSMDLDNSNSKNDPTLAGPAYGVGYGDAQCPDDIKYVNRGDGLGFFPNVDATVRQPCASEMDIWEANSISNALTPHPCLNEGTVMCNNSVDCGIGSDRYKGFCDKDGADYNPYRVGITDFYGKEKTVDSTKPMTVITQFITSDATDEGDLVEIKRYYKQNGKVIAGGSVTDALTEQRKKSFNETNHFQERGGLKTMGSRLKDKMVLVLSVWGDTLFNMEWLDSTFPENTNINGSARGPCPKGTYEETVRENPNAYVTFSDIQVGSITQYF